VTSKALQERIARRLRKAGASHQPELVQRLERYLRFLTKWNSKINLTAFRLIEPSDEAIDRLRRMSRTPLDE
jgi:16S rRNA G527 N7-methylase RsmG